MTLPPPRPLGTLFGVPFGAPTTTTDVAIVGLPFDVGTHPNRIGAREAPAHVRRHSLAATERAEGYGVPPLVALDIVDCGDLDLTPGLVEPALERIEAAVGAVLDAGAVPLTLGGDGTVTLPQLRAVAARYPDLVVVHFDAHTDAYEFPHPYPIHNGNAFEWAVTEELVDPGASLHVGLRETAVGDRPGWLALAAQLGYQLITIDEIETRGIAAVSARIADTLRGRPVYVCWDMDVFDPGIAPGVATPWWGGLTAREGLALIRGLAGLDLVAFDLNAISPPHDIGGQTGSLAAQVALEFLVLVAAHRRRP
jgi:agmatinase